MPLFELTPSTIMPLSSTTFEQQAITERSDLQRLLRDDISVVAADLKVICEEFCEWEDSKRRIDLLAVDGEANLVVVELKRSEDGGHMELQSIRYAAMVSQMTFKQAASTLAKYKKIGEDEAEADLLEFFEWDDQSQTEDFGRSVRIILVSAEFSKELTTSVMWLNNQGLDITCIRLRPYCLDGTRTILDVQRIVPLPEADEYTIQLKKKAEETKLARTFNPDFSKYVLTVNGRQIRDLKKRALFYEVVKAVLQNGASPQQVRQQLQPIKWIQIEGEWHGEDVRKRLSEMHTKLNSKYDVRRYFCGDGEPFVIDGYTWVLSNQWAKLHLPLLDNLIALSSNAKIEYGKQE